MRTEFVVLAHGPVGPVVEARYVADTATAANKAESHAKAHADAVHESTGVATSVVEQSTWNDSRTIYTRGGNAR